MVGVIKHVGPLGTSSAILSNLGQSDTLYLARLSVDIDDPPPDPVPLFEGLALCAVHVQGLEAAYRGTSLIRNTPLLGPYSRPMPIALRWS